METDRQTDRHNNQFLKPHHMAWTTGKYCWDWQHYPVVQTASSHVSDNLMVSYLSAIHRRDYWYATVSKSYCFESSNIDTCTFYFSFCHPVPPEVNGKCYENGACQIGERGNNRQVYGMGLFTNLTRFIPSECHIYQHWKEDYLLPTWTQKITCRRLAECSSFHRKRKK